MKRFVYSFNEGDAEMRDLLGEKGANLAEMTKIGLPVPFGFTLTTEACNKYYADGQELDEQIAAEIREKMEELENVTEKKFGDRENPLLVSVRSGAAVSMPGMLDTILNLGLNDETVMGLAEQTGNARFAWDSYRRFIQMFGHVVLGISPGEFDAVLQRQKQKAGVPLDVELSARDLQEIVAEDQALVKAATGREFPQDPQKQLKAAIQAVFRSWNSQRARLYRKQNRISDSLGTAVNVQFMVFGNMGDDSCTGIAFTRNPETGEHELSGEFLVNGQGEDVTAGIRTPRAVREMAQVFPEAYKKFENIGKVLERHYKDMQDMAFTIERNKLYMLQTRTAGRTAAAAVRAAVDMAEEGLISRETAVLRIDPTKIDRLLHPGMDPDENLKAILSWADDIRTLKVRTNADNPRDARQALQFGAEGIGLCRTEHMFFETERIPVIRQMIMADSEEERIVALDKLLDYQKSDFREMYACMEDKPVTIRLLDPPLHEFLPKTDEEREVLMEITGLSSAALLKKTEELQESNPMLGHRGCRLLITHPEIAKMQTSAIMQAAIEVALEKEIDIVPEIMIPLVGSREEIEKVKDVVVLEAERCKAAYSVDLDYQIGTMIEIPRAALMADEIAREADFFSFGTNDLTQMTFGLSRDDTSALIQEYMEEGVLAEDPFSTLDQQGVGKLIETGVRLGRQTKPNLKLGVCGDHAGDPKSIEFFHQAGLNYVSCSAYRVPVARIAAAQAAIRSKKNM